MELSERVSYEKSVGEYIESTRLVDMVESFTKQLIVHQPADPISFLIEHITNKRSQRLIFVTGGLPAQRKDIVEYISRTFNYASIDVEAEEGGANKYKDRHCDITNAHVKELLLKVEKHFRGVVLSGYPFDFETAIFAQQNGLLPDRMILLSATPLETQAYYETVYNKQAELIQQAQKRDELNQEELKQMYAGFFDEFTTSSSSVKADTHENIKHILKLQDRIIPPLRSPRVIIVRPRHIRSKAKAIAETISKRYGFNSISTSGMLEKHIEDKTEIGKFVYQAIINRRAVPDEIILGLIRGQTLSASTKKRGYILEGFPQSNWPWMQLQAITNYQMNPHIVIILDEEESVLVEEIKQLRMDPTTGRTYERFDKVNADKLTMNNSTDEEVKALAAEFKQIAREAEKKFGKAVLKFSISEDTQKILKQIDVFLNNPAVYS